MKTLNILKDNIISFLFVSFIFLYIFQPCLPLLKLPHSLDFIIIVYFFYCLLTRKRIILGWIKNFIGFIPFIIYITILYLFNYILGSYTEGYIHTYIASFMTILHAFLGITFLLTFSSNHNYKNKMIHFFLCATALQFICVLLAFCFEPIKMIFHSLIVLYSNSDVMKAAIASETFRGFGFAGNLFDLFGVNLSLLIVLFFVKALNENNKLYFISSLVFLFMVLVNARTGLLLALIGFFIACIYLGRKFSFPKIIVGVLLFVFIALSLFPLINYVPERIQRWLSFGVECTVRLILEGKKEGVYSEILGNDLDFVPNNIYFGDGIMPVDVGDGSIDNGYMQCLWLFGIIGIVLYFSGLLIFFIKIYRLSKQNASKCICVCYFIMYAVYTIKLFPLYFSNLNFILFGLPLLLSMKDSTYCYKT